MNEYENAIEISGLTKRYAGFAPGGVSFDVPKGGIMGFIGQNGAGKTTTIRSLLNITGIDGGSIRLLPEDHVITIPEQLILDIPLYIAGTAVLVLTLRGKEKKAAPQGGISESV